MEINRQLFEDVLAGKLKGTFVFRNQLVCNSDELTRNTTDNKSTYPYSIRSWSYTPSGIYRFYCKSNVDIVDFIPDTDMKENELTIEIPDGKTVDWKESKKQNKIVLKEKQSTYAKICKELFGKDYYFIDQDGSVEQIFISNRSTVADKNNASTKHQLECILAKNQLANVAVYLNDGWKPDKGDHVFAITYRGNFDNGPIIGEFYFGCGENLVVFKTQKTAQQAIEILGEETIKLALEPLGV